MRATTVTCDSCKKPMLPDSIGWRITVQITKEDVWSNQFTNWTDYDFCSFNCLKSWVLSASWETKDES